MFKNDLKLYVYPLMDRETGELTTVENLEIAPELRKLYDYLVGKGCIEQLHAYNPEHLSTFSREVLKMIESGDDGWKKHVPPEVATVIQKRGFFGCKSHAPESRLAAMVAANSSSFGNIPAPVGFPV